MNQSERLERLEKEVRGLKERVVLSEKIMKLEEQIMLLKEKLNQPQAPVIYPVIDPCINPYYPGLPQPIWYGDVTSGIIS